jgi:small GTP-binding protein
MLRSDLRNLKKISFVGSPAVGKTTMLKLLSNITIDRMYLPTHGLDLKTVKLDDYILRVWDFGGQGQYLRSYSGDHLLGSDVLFIVTDSSPRNVLNSRELINYSTHFVDEDCPIVAIANKQDLRKSDGRMDPKRVEDILQVKTYGLTAIDPNQREKLIDIIRKELNQVVVRRRIKEIEI